MKQSRTDKIDFILNEIKPQPELVSIPIELWIAANDENDERFKEWVYVCKQMVRIDINGEKDRDSLFAKVARENG